MSHYKTRIDAETGVDKMMNMENALKDAEKRNQELLREIKAL